MKKRLTTAAVVLAVGLSGALAPAPTDGFSVNARPASASPASALTSRAAAVPAAPATPVGVAALPARGLPAQPAPPPSTTPMCRQGQGTVTTFNDDIVAPPLGWADNVVFDGHGGMWVSRVLLNEVQRYDPSGAITKSVPIEGPAGMALGPDGMLYVNQDLVGVSRARIARFDPTAETPAPEVFATGLPGANGLAADGEGNLYVGIVGPMLIGNVPSLVKVLPDGTIDQSWSARADFANANGVAVRGDSLYVNRWTDINSPIERVPLDDPAMHEKVAQLTPDLELGDLAPPKVLDDLAFGADGSLYTVAYATGELLRVNVRRGSACVVANGFFTPTSVHAPQAFGDFDPARHLFVTTATGMIHLVELPPS